MFSNQGIHPVTIYFSNTKNCFLHLAPKLVSHLLLNENQALELSWGSGTSAFLSWTCNRNSSNDTQRVELCRQLGERLGIEDGEQGFIKPCRQVSSVHQVFVEPLSFDDWEILELHSSALETHLLDQIRVVFQDAVFPVWVDTHTAIYIQIASFLPSVPFGRLEQFTELIVSPKNRPDINISGSLFKSSKNQKKEGLPKSDISSSVVPPAQQWGTGLKSLVQYLLMGPVKELPSVPDLPLVITDSVFRVCGAPPDSLCTISHRTTDVVHVFPFSHALSAGHTGGQSQITYGMLTKVPFSKEVKHKDKADLDKKRSVSKTTADSDRGETLKDDEAVVVRVVCREKLTHKGSIKRSIHSGKVWISEQLAAKMNVIPHSAVRIKPIKSAVKVATMIQLQPMIPMSEDDDEIRTVFLGWLHTQSHEPLACLTARCSTILLHGSEAKLQFALTVLKPESADDPIDQLFLLAATLLKNEDIQIRRDTLTNAAEKSPDKISNEELPSLSSLGGIDKVSTSAHEFISHSLLAGPLSVELGSSTQGLQGGALLITGAKGCGKSSFARALCRKVSEDLDAHVEILHCKKLQGKRAETVRQMLQDVFEQAEWKQPSVVLLDDLDQITGAPSLAEHEHSPEVLLQQYIAQSLKDVVDDVVQRSSLVSLIITSKSQDSLHPSLTELQGSHFFQRISHIEPPDQGQRADILRCLIARKGLSEETLQTLDVGAIAKLTEGYTPQDLALLLERAIHASAVQKQRDHLDGLLSADDFSQALKGFTPPSLWGVELHSPSGVGLEQVGGLKDVRQQLMDTIMLPAKYPILFSKLPIRHRSGVLLYGAPGTGKTLLVRAVAKDSGMNFISIKGPELLSKYIGASEQAVRDVFQKAQAAKPCILFFDEFDSLAPRRGHDSTGVTDRVVNQLLTQLDGVEGLQGVYVLAATSRPDLIDPALLRPGRLDKCLYCPPPDLVSRLEILTTLSSGLSLAVDVDLEQLAADTKQFTGADLKALLYNAQLEAIHSSSTGSPPQGVASGSESEMSLSSMIFPNHSSGSEDSVGEGDMGLTLEQSVLLLENSDFQTYEENRGNIWRIYFGSSYESELGYSPELVLSNPRCLSGPMSENQDLTATCVRDAGSDLPPLYMPSLQSGCEELSPEQQEQLTRDVNTIKKNYKKESVQVHTPSSPPVLLISQAHIKCALSTTKPSVSKADWSRYTRLYESFDGSGDGKPLQIFKPGQRVTLA
ncbi:hypothetical protein NQD34_008378 [Periophthalmus magnuspinnatus]|nr:hypothetical protein NQD34_008378 [Periophthalmus magnuspinnatus]